MGGITIFSFLHLSQTVELITAFNVKIDEKYRMLVRKPIIVAKK
jgi:hypothetical protein